ncbi:MAG TPA: hypothetical protein VMT18_04075, partial [Planctomycetota bacterium]|nr:hypothetical protein [Planctomycetota bacterium]
MNDQLEPEDEELIVAVVTREIAPDDPRVVRCMREDPGFVRRLEELRELQRLLEGDARDEREALHAAPPRPLWRRRAPWLALAAAALAALLLWPEAVKVPSDSAEPPRTLGAGGLELRELQPAGDGADLGRYSFVADLPPGASSRVRIWAHDAAPDARPLVERSFRGLSVTLDASE